MSRKNREDRGALASKETRMEMTPMIDVTFLLLTFFLCSVKFRVLEGLLPMHLPRDIPNGIPFTGQTEVLDVSVHRTHPVSECRAEAAAEGRPNPQGNWVWREDQVEVFLGRRRMADMTELRRTLERLVEPYREHGIPPSEWPSVLLIPRPGSLYVDSVKVLDELLRAGFEHICVSRPPRDA